MTHADAVASFRVRMSTWADPCDVEERLAIRFAHRAELGDERTFRVLAVHGTVRAFIELDHGQWLSAYVHSLSDVDRLMEMASEAESA